MAYVDFLAEVHGQTRRDYLGRVNEYPKAEAAKVAKQFGREYWDGDRRLEGGSRGWKTGAVVNEDGADHAPSPAPVRPATRQ